VNDARKILLDVGCGRLGASETSPVFEGWRHIRVDVDPAVQPDIIADLRDLAPIGPGVADALWAAHCLEHLHEHQLALALSEIRRVLKDDGFACIIVPDLQTVAALIAEDRMDEPAYMSAAGPITPHDIVFGFGAAIARGESAMAHRCGFTPAAMTRRLVAARFGGFRLLRRPGFELVAVIRKTEWADARECEALLLALNL
jgi:SAM-dependent methyltransferase